MIGMFLSLIQNLWRKIQIGSRKILIIKIRIVVKTTITGS